MDRHDHPLRVYRQQNDLRLEDLAPLVGTTIATLSRIENRQISPTHRLLIKISGATGISIDELVRAGAEAA